MVRALLGIALAVVVGLVGVGCGSSGPSREEAAAREEAWSRAQADRMADLQIQYDEERARLGAEPQNLP